MERSLADLQAIKTELATDPSALGYTGVDASDAEALNLERASITSQNVSVDPQEIRDGVTLSDFSGLPAAERQYLQLMLQGDSVTISKGGEARKALTAMFGAGSDTRANLLPMIQKNGSRIDELFEAGTLESDRDWGASDIADARRS